MSLRDKTSEHLRGLLAFYDTDRLRAHYRSLIADVRAELERRRSSQLELESCSHPDPATTPWVFCRTCGYWVDGVRVSDATDAVLRGRLAEAAVERTPVQLHLPCQICGKPADDSCLRCGAPLCHATLDATGTTCVMRHLMQDHS